MKKRPTPAILRIFYYAVFITFILACLTAYSALNAPMPEPEPGSDFAIRAFEIESGSKELISARNQSLSELINKLWVLPQAQKYSQKQVIAPIETVRARILESTALENPAVHKSKKMDFVKSREIISSALNEADLLFFQRISDETETALAVKRRSMGAESDLFLNRLASIAIKRVLERDVLGYREMNSLSLYEDKVKFYEERAEAIKKQIGELRKSAENEINARKSQGEIEYQAKLDELILKTTEEWEQSLEKGQFEIEEVKERLEKIRERTAQMGTEFHENQAGFAGSQCPELCHISWIDKEGDYLKAFQKQLKPVEK